MSPFKALFFGKNTSLFCPFLIDIFSFKIRSLVINFSQVHLKVWNIPIVHIGQNPGLEVITPRFCPHLNFEWTMSSECSSVHQPSQLIQVQMALDSSERAFHRPLLLQKVCIFLAYLLEWSCHRIKIIWGESGIRQLHCSNCSKMLFVSLSSWFSSLSLLG